MPYYSAIPEAFIRSAGSVSEIKLYVEVNDTEMRNDGEGLKSDIS